MVALVAAAVVVAVEVKGCMMVVLGILRSDNGDVHENVAEKQTLHPFKLFRDYPKSSRYLNDGNLGLSSEKRRDRAQVQTEMVEFITLPFPFSSKLTIWSFHVVVVQGQQRNL